MPTSALMTIAAVLGLGGLFVLLPVAVLTYQRLRYKRALTCPETNKAVEIVIDAPRAALSAVFGSTKLRVRDCSSWPERKGCAEKCVASE